LTSGTLVAGAAYATAAALVYGFVAHRMARRNATNPEVRFAASLYALWWAGVGATSVVVAASNALGAAGVRSLIPYIALDYLGLLAVCVAVWGLLYYVAYLLWGNGNRILTVLTLFYGANVLIILVQLTLARPMDVHVSRWRADLVYDQSTAPAVVLALGTLVLLPIMIATVAYFSVYFQAVDASARYRVAAVTTSILVWLEGLFLGHIPSLADHDGWQIAGHLATFASALIVLAAYHPPAWLARQLAADVRGTRLPQASDGDRR